MRFYEEEKKNNLIRIKMSPPLVSAKSLPAGTVKSGQDNKKYVVRFVHKKDGTKYKRWVKKAKQGTTKKPKSAWIQAVLQYKNKHGCSFKEALKQTSKTYKKSADLRS